jgi:hypothetical protein
VGHLCHGAVSSSSSTCRGSGGGAELGETGSSEDTGTTMKGN